MPFPVSYHKAIANYTKLWYNAAMIDINIIRKNPETVKQTAIDKNIKCDVDRVVESDKIQRKLTKQRDDLKHYQKEIGKLIANMAKVSKK